MNVFRAQAENQKAACQVETCGKGKGNTANTLKEQQRLGVFSSSPGSQDAARNQLCVSDVDFGSGRSGFLPVGRG